MLITPINIDHWWRGRGPSVSALLVHRKFSDKKKLPYPQRCCLGHAAVAAGDNPPSGSAVIAYAPSLLNLVLEHSAAGGNSWIVRRLYDLNDTTSCRDERRRQQIVETGKLVGIAFCFFVTNEDVD